MVREWKAQINMELRERHKEGRIMVGHTYLVTTRIVDLLDMGDLRLDLGETKLEV